MSINNWKFPGILFLSFLIDHKMLTIKFNPTEFRGETWRISANRSTCTNLHSTFLSPRKIDFRGEMSRRFAMKSKSFQRNIFSSVSNFLLFLHEKKAIVHGEKNKRGKFISPAL